VINNPISPGSASDYKPKPELPEDICVPDHHLNGSKGSGSEPSAPNDSFIHLAPLDLKEGKPDTGIYIPTPGYNEEYPSFEEHNS